MKNLYLPFSLPFLSTSIYSQNILTGLPAQFGVFTNTHSGYANLRIASSPNATNNWLLIIGDPDKGRRETVNALYLKSLSANNENIGFIERIRIPGYSQEKITLFEYAFYIRQDRYS